MDKFILPNFHAFLIHFPLGMLGTGVLIELFSFLWRRSSFRTAGRWLILLGTLMAVPAATSGLYAFRDVVGHGNEADSWMELKAGSNFTAVDWRFVRYHIILNSAATGVALFAVVMWLGASDLWRKILPRAGAAPAHHRDGTDGRWRMAWGRDGVSARIRRAGKTRRIA